MRGDRGRREGTVEDGRGRCQQQSGGRGDSSAGNEGGGGYKESKGRWRRRKGECTVDATRHRDDDENRQEVAINRR